MSTKKIALSTFWQLGSQAITMLIGILSIKFVTTALSQSMVGNYQTVYSYLQIFGILADFGLYAIAVRELGKADDFISTFANLFILRALVMAVSLGSAVAIVWFLPVFYGTPLPMGVTIAALVPCFTLLAGMFRAVFQVSYKMQYVFASEMAGKTIPVLLMGYVLFTGVRESGLSGYYFAFLGFGGLGALTMFILLFSFANGLPTLLQAKSSGFGSGLPSVCPGLPGWFAKFDRVEFGRLMRLAVPFGFAFLMTTVYRQSDVTLMAMLRPHDYDLQNAHYGTILRLAEVGFLIPTFILNSALPIMSAGEHDGNDMSSFISTLLYGILALSSVISLTSYFWARPIVLLIMRETYLSTASSAGSDTALRLISFSMFLSAIVTSCFYVLLMKHQWKRLIVATGCAALLSLSLNLFLIPLFGFVGAAITSIFVHIVLSIMLVVAAFGLSGVFEHVGAVSHIMFFRKFAKFSRFARLIAFCTIYGLTLVWTAPLLSGPIMTIVGGMGAILVAALLAWATGILGEIKMAFGKGV